MKHRSEAKTASRFKQVALYVVLRTALALQAELRRRREEDRGYTWCNRNPETNLISQGERDGFLDLEIH